ncbi:MAG: hypothetical protein M3Y87_29820 [Myxococcota bacterium]|nr:hypothetical protein [Myxococcota bacterium]
MRALGIAVVLMIAATCSSPYAGRVRTDHAREFGCQERWVQVREQDEPGRWQATGCGFRSEWSCAQRECRMRDSRSYGVDSP